jgi:hypothetical protein
MSLVTRLKRIEQRITPQAPPIERVLLTCRDGAGGLFKLVDTRPVLAEEDELMAKLLEMCKILEK